jgi:hypothetical protein
MSHSLTIDSTKPFSALNERLHASTDGRFWLGRLWQTVKTSWQDQGAVKAAGVLSGYTAVKAYTCFFAYLCLEGAYRSFEEASIAYREEGHVTRELGDAGGWTSLAMFSLFALGATLTQCIREFEYDDIKRICNDWYEEVGKQEIIVDREEFYAHLCKILSNFSAQCLSQKSIVSQRLTALEIMQSLNDLNYAGDAAEGSELHLDRELKRFYLLVHAERTNKVAFANYFERLKTGLRAVKAQQGIWGQFKAISTGVACPIIFTANSLLSYIGEVPLMKQVFGQREDLLQWSRICAGRGRAS